MSGKIGCNRPETFHGEESPKPSKYHHGPPSALKRFQSRISPPKNTSPSTNPSKVIHRRATTYGEGRPEGFLPLAPKRSPLRSGGSGSSGIKIKRVWTVDDNHTTAGLSTLSLRDME